MGDTKNGLLFNNTFTYNWDGIELYLCDNINITENIITTSFQAGITSDSCDNTNIRGNFLRDNNLGIYAHSVFQCS